VRDVKIVGGPSRARLSADATRAASTVFVSGHSYLDTGFSTVTEIVDTTTGKGFGNLETYRIVKNGAAYKNVDVNFWGVTFASADEFHATPSTQGGDLPGPRQRGRPGGHRAAGERRVPVAVPRRHEDRVQEGVRGQHRTQVAVHRARPAHRGETPLPETRSIDDQLAWLDDSHVMYGVPRGASGRSDVWVSPLSGGTPKLLVPDADSPAAVIP
jgi:hypothetical protein